MKFDTAFIDLTNVTIAAQEQNNVLFLKIMPITYTDKRNPRLPRKQSKQTDLQGDTNHIFQHSFAQIKSDLSSTKRYKVDIKVYKSNDKLGGGDLDNYCKSLLDAITSTKKVWKDDKQVDEIAIKRYLTKNHPKSYMELRISEL